jgi:hypothetical protein
MYLKTDFIYFFMTLDKKHLFTSQAPLVKATQIAFEMEQEIANKIRMLAAHEGLTASDQIRKMVGLKYSSPKRPRLTISLNNDDYAVLAEKYSLPKEDMLGIKRKIVEELIQLIKG